MERRTGHTPMDFEYDNRAGQIDSGSPFPKGDPNKRGFGTVLNQPGAFRPDLLFGNAPLPASTLPQTPIKNHLSGFRDNPSNALDFSSGAENQSSPDNADNDNDDDTPDVPKTADVLGENVTIFRGRSPSKPSPWRRESISNYFSSRWGSSRHQETLRPGRGREIQRRVHKRKRRELDHGDNNYNNNYNNGRTVSRHRRGSSDSGGEEEEWDSRPSSSEAVKAATTTNKNAAPPSASAPQEVVPVGLVPAFFAFLHRHPDLPLILSNYGQTLLGWFVTFTIIAFIYAGWAAVRADVDMAVQRATQEIVREIGVCSDHYYTNGCGGPQGPPPALRAACQDWDACVNRDPLLVGKAQVSAKTFSRVLSEFFDQMSWKFISFILGTMFIMCMAPRQLFGNLRARHQNQSSPSSSHSSTTTTNAGAGAGGLQFAPPLPPPTPQHLLHLHQYQQQQQQHQQHQQQQQAYMAASPWPGPQQSHHFAPQQQPYFTPHAQRYGEGDGAGTSTGGGGVFMETESPSRRGRNGDRDRGRESPVRRIGYM